LPKQTAKKTTNANRTEVNKTANTLPLKAKYYPQVAALPCAQKKTKTRELDL